VLTSTIEFAFEKLFCDQSPNPAQIADARSVLSSVDGRTFTSAAMQVLRRTGLKPSSIPTRGSKMWFSRDRSRSSGWKFLVAIQTDHSYRQTTWWLSTDGQWLISDQSFQSSVFQMTNTASFDMTSERLGQLISSRSSRVATWLDKPRGRLNMGVK